MVSTFRAGEERYYSVRFKGRMYQALVAATSNTVQGKKQIDRCIRIVQDVNKHSRGTTVQIVVLYAVV